MLELVQVWTKRKYFIRKGEKNTQWSVYRFQWNDRDGIRRRCKKWLSEKSSFKTEQLFQIVLVLEKSGTVRALIPDPRLLEMTQYQTLTSPPESVASREVANLTKRKNMHTLSTVTLGNYIGPTKIIKKSSLSDK